MNSKLKTLVTGAVMIALATCLSFIKIKIPGWSFGGSITLGSMVPIVVFSMMYNFKWGVTVSFAYSLIQMLTGFYPPPANDVLSFVAVVLLDYVVAFGILGFAGLISRAFNKLGMNKILAAVIASALVVIVRFLCHFTTGIIIWESYAPEGVPVWLYSLGYNGGYMAGELVITSVIVALIFPFIVKQAKKSGGTLLG